MPRNKEFDVNQVINKSLLTFWEKGYNATSISDLEKSTGISRISLYNAFKDKESIFVECLSSYSAFADETLQKIVSGQGLMGITSFFRLMYQEDENSKGSKFGCLAVNTILEINEISDSIKTLIENHMDKFYDAFLKELKMEIKENNLEIKSAPGLAQFLVNNMNGIAIQMRLNKDPKTIKESINTLISYIENLNLKGQVFL